jgi:hypothetical protein
MNQQPSTEEIVEHFRYLWDGSDPGWVMARASIEDESLVVIVHEPTNTDLTIEDDEAFEEIIRRMRAAGVRVID